MHKLVVWLLLSSQVAVVACHGDDDAPATKVGSASPPPPVHRAVEQVTPPLDLQTPPADATKTASGLVYKKLVVNDAGVQARSDETVLVRYTGWRQPTGDTFFSTRGRDQPIAIELAHAATRFREALSLLHKGERAMLWLPPGEGSPEPVAYEVELVDVVARPAAPTCVAAPDREAGTAVPDNDARPAEAKRPPNGVKARTGHGSDWPAN